MRRLQDDKSYYVFVVLYSIALALLLFVFVAVLQGCGGGNAQVAAEGARAAACEATEQELEDRVNRGSLSREDAFLRLDCVRLVCDQIHARLAEEE